MSEKSQTEPGKARRGGVELFTPPNTPWGEGKLVLCCPISQFSGTPCLLHSVRSSPGLRMSLHYLQVTGQDKRWDRSPGEALH